MNQILQHRYLAENQLGVLSIDQALGAGLTRAQIRHEVDTGRLARVGVRLLRVVGSAPEPAQRLLAATLDCGGVVSHESAAAWWGLPGFRIEPIHVTTVRTARPSACPLAMVHRMRALADRHRTVLDGVPVVRPELLALQLAGSVHPLRAERNLDRLWSERLLSGSSTRQVLDEVAASGVRGVRVIRDLLDARGPDYVPPASGLEARFAQILHEGYEAPMLRQVDLGDEEHWCGRVDFADPAVPGGHRAVIEVQSERFHSALVDVRADEQRLSGLARAGFIVGTVTDHQVWHRRAEVLAEVRHVRSLARRGNLTAPWS